MTLVINGEARTGFDGGTVTDLVTWLGLPAPTLLVEHNGTALRRDEWLGRSVIDGDKFEIMRISAGG